MTSSEARDYFDKILNAVEGTKITIPCDSQRDQNSARTLMYRERGNYVVKAGEHARNIGIQRLTVNEELAQTLGSKHFVVLHVEKQRAPAIIELPDGTTEQFTPTPAHAVALDHGLSPAQQRVYDMMLADGITHEAALTNVKEMEVKK